MENRSDLPASKGARAESLVCAYCFDDPGIRDFIKNGAEAGKCSYCLSSYSVPTVKSIDEVAKYINECLYKEYDEAANHLWYEGSEGGYFGKCWDTYELLTDEIKLSLPRSNSHQLFLALATRLDNNTWCEAWPYELNADEQTRLSWEHFCDTVMHRRRFFFLDFRSDPDDFEVDSPGEILKAIFSVAEQLDLLKQLPTGTQLLRARYEGPEVQFATAQELGPPPQDKATQANRMNPPGIPMFYACDDERTALQETAKKEQPGKFAVAPSTRCVPLPCLISLRSHQCLAYSSPFLTICVVS